MLASFPDMRSALHDHVGEGDRVFVRLSLRGTDSGKGSGQFPPGRRAE